MKLNYKYMTVKQIKKLWFKFYNENLKTEYSGFYKELKKLEIKENKILKKSREI
jgi:hypothetical protein